MHYVTFYKVHLVIRDKVCRGFLYSSLFQLANRMNLSVFINAEMQSKKVFFNYLILLYQISIKRKRPVFHFWLLFFLFNDIKELPVLMAQIFRIIFVLLFSFDCQSFLSYTQWKKNCTHIYSFIHSSILH